MAQLNQNCIVSVLNRSVPVRADGTWVLPNIPANFGRVRARATCVEDGVTRSGESSYFTLGANESVDIPPIVLGPTTPIPSALTVSSPTNQLSQQNRTAQLLVMGDYAGGPARNLTAGSSGTTYTISNRAIATITPDGLVTAVASGIVVIQASHEGTQGLLSLRVVLSGDSDGDGIPDDVELREGMNPNDATDGLADLDSDGLSNRRELMEFGTNIRNRDTDGDGLTDGQEVNGVNGFTSNPLVADTDGDGVGDGLEVQSGTNPREAGSVNYAAVTARIEVTPGNFVLMVNALNPLVFTQLNVRATLTDNTTVDLTSRNRGTSYASSNLNVCNFGAIDGRVFAGLAGACTITVSAAGRTATVLGEVQTFQPFAVSQIEIPGYANNVEVSGGYAYVAAGATGLQVVNVSNAQNPSLVGARDTAGNANDVRVSGELAYVADGTNGLVILNVSTPGNPLIVGGVDTPGEAVDVWVAGNYAYIADGGSGMSIVDVTNPAVPVLVSTTATGGIARGIAVSGDLAVVVSDVTNTLRTFNVTNRANPVALGSLNLSGSLKDVALNGTMAAVAAHSGGAHFVDFSAATSPRLLGSVAGALPSGVVPRDVEFVTGFAVFAEELFPNAAAFVDISNPASPSMRGAVDFSAFGVSAGTGIAVRAPFVYKTGERPAVVPENGVTGFTSLYIGQYLPLEDRAGIPPRVSLQVGPGASPRLQGSRIQLSAEASDDIAVASVNFLVDGNVVFTDTSAPYEYSFLIPNNVSRLSLRAEAVDSGNNRGSSAEVQVEVVPDPLTTVSGRVVDSGGVPIVGAQLTATGGFTGISGNDGRFRIAGVTTVNGNITALATITQNSVESRGSSSSVAPVPGGVTELGDIRVIPAQWETQIGPCSLSGTNGFTPVSLPFAFPFYGTARTTAFVGTSGYITFNAGDTRSDPALALFTPPQLPRIAVLMGGFSGGAQGCTHINTSIAGRVVVTYSRVVNTMELRTGGSNTFQMILFSDGRIQFGYRGVTALGNLMNLTTGLFPGPTIPSRSVNYSDQPSVDVSGGTSVFEGFNASNLFDLDGGFIVFTPTAGGGYNIRTIMGVSGASRVLVSGGAAASAGALAQSVEAPEDLRLSLQREGRLVIGGSDVPAEVIANAEVEVRSSTDAGYRGMTNTDRRGNFTMSGVPPGGIQVEVRKNGQVVGRGTAIVPPLLMGQSAVTVVLVDPAASPKK